MGERVYVIFECDIPETFVRGIFTNKEDAENNLNILNKNKAKFGQSFFISCFILDKLYINSWYGEPKEQ